MKLISCLASLALALLIGCKAVGPDVATSYNNIGLVHYKKAEYDKALEYYQKSVAISYWSIGAVWIGKKDLAKAKEFIGKGHAILLKKLGPNHRGQARSS